MSINAASSLMRGFINAATKLQKPTKKRHVVKRLLKERPQLLYSVIVDVDSYARFVPLCASSEVLRRSKCGTMFDASLSIGLGLGIPYPTIPSIFSMSPDNLTTTRRNRKSSEPEQGLSLLSETYVSRVTVDPTNYEVSAYSIKCEKFDSLSSRWKIIPVNDEGDETTRYNVPANTERAHWSWVEFEVEMSVSDPSIASVLDIVLKDVADSQVLAFENRCRELR